MTLQEAVSICKKETDGRIPIAGYETENFYVFTSLGYKIDEPLAGGPMFAVDKHNRQTGFLASYIQVLCSEGVKSGWEQFKSYESDEVIRDTETNDEFRRALKECSK